MRIFRLFALLLVTVLCFQCAFKWEASYGTPFEDSSTSSAAGASSETGTSGGGTVSPLPEPDTWYVPPPVLTPEQELRKQQVDQYLAEQYSGYDIVKATQGYSGDIYYWVRPETMPGWGNVPPAVPWTADDLIPAAGADLGRPELERYPELRGPDWATPIRRADFSAFIMGLTSATSPQDYLQNYQVAGQPAGTDRRYAGLNAPIENNGVSGTINQFHVDVEPGTFTLIELAVACPKFGPMQEQIGVVVSLDRANPSDGRPRLHVEFMTQGGNNFGQPRIGGWDDLQEGFVLYADAKRKYSPGDEVPASVLGGEQHEHRLDIFQAPNRDWWIAHNGNLLGYYPADLFTLLNNGACRAAWYGEVFDKTPQDWTWTDMGSSQFAGVGHPNAAYVRNPKLHSLTAPSWYPTETFKYMEPYNVACYTRTYMTYGFGPFFLYFFLGGPGGDAPGCD